MVETAVFDLDGTLLDGDSTSAWLRDRFAASPPRAALAFGMLPIAASMMLVPALRKFGGSLMLWIATFGLDDDGLRRSFEAFAARVAASQSRLAWRPGGLATLAGHQAQGHLVVIATAAPAGLAAALAAGLPNPPAVVGSTLRRVAGGWVGDRHCRHDAKCRMLAEANHGERWSHAYSDSADDLPMLARAETAWLVHASPAGEARVRRSLSAVKIADWSRAAYSSFGRPS